MVGKKVKAFIQVDGKKVKDNNVLILDKIIGDKEVLQEKVGERGLVKAMEIIPCTKYLVQVSHPSLLCKIMTIYPTDIIAVVNEY